MICSVGWGSSEGCTALVGLAYFLSLVLWLFWGSCEIPEAFE